MVLSFSAWCF